MSFQAMRRAFARAAASSARCPPKGTVAAERGRWDAARSFAPELEATSSPLRRVRESGPAIAQPFMRAARRRVHTDDPYTPAHRAKAVAMAGPLGLVAGCFGSLVGVGGGVLIVPAITAAVPIPQRVVTGTSLIAVLSTAAVSTYNFSHAGLVDPTAAAIIGGAAMLSAPFGARLTTRLDCVQLRRVLAYFLLCAAPLVPLKAAVFHLRGGDDNTKVKGEDGDGSVGDTGGDGGRHWTDGDNAEKGGGGSNTNADESVDPTSFDAVGAAPKLAAIGLTAGLASGLLGIGGGTIVTPLLALVSPLPQAAVLGTSLLAMLPPSAVALAQHRALGNVDPRMGLALAAGTAVGGAVGSGMAVDAPRGALEAVFFFGMLFLSKRTFATIRPKLPKT
tara:strand:+ start:807 stop:1979 length:1173 start_codon:yes stop_codon:yes gene_type:complete